MHSRYSVTLRGSGERTEPLIANLVAKLPVPTAHIQSDPFENTLKLSYAAAIKMGSQWSVMLDADVIPDFDGLEKLICIADSLPSHCLGASAQTFDKILNRIRPVGIRVFRTTVLSQLIDQIPPSGTTERPETASHRVLEETGLTYRKVRCFCGYHAFEQYYSDLISSTLNLAKKSNLSDERFPSQWAKLGNEDQDYVAMQIGASLGTMSSASAVISRAAHSSMIEDLFSAFSISEKSSLDSLPKRIEPVETNEQPMSIAKHLASLASSTARKLAGQQK